MSSVVLISALQQSDSVMHVYIYVLFYICSIMVYPCTLTYSFPCCTGGSCGLSVLYMIVRIY